MEYKLWNYLIAKNIDMRKQKNETVVLKKGNNDIQLDYAELRKAVLGTQSGKPQIASTHYRLT